MVKEFDESYDITEVKLDQFILAMKTLGLETKIFSDKSNEIIPVMGNGKHCYPRAISIELTHRCNAKCLHCYGGYSADKPASASFEQVKWFLGNCRETGVRVIELTGGEITVYPHLKQVLEEVYHLGFKSVSLLTNGINISEDIMQLIIDNQDKTALQIDLHGYSDKYINWFMGVNVAYIKKIIQSNIARLYNHGIRIRVATIVTPKNVNQIEDIADWVYSMGIRCYGLSPVANVGRAMIYQDELLYNDLSQIEALNSAINNIARKYGDDFLYKVDSHHSSNPNCGAFTSNPTVDPEGNLKFCSMDDQSTMRTIGNVYQTPISDIYDRNYELMKALRSLPAPHQDLETCRDCGNLSFCHGCIVRGLMKADLGGKECCRWYQEIIPDSIKRVLLR